MRDIENVQFIEVQHGGYKGWKWLVICRENGKFKVHSSDGAFGWLPDAVEDVQLFLEKRFNFKFD